MPSFEHFVSENNQEQLTVLEKLATSKVITF